MKWIIDKNKKGGLPIKSWCKDVDELAMQQAENLSVHPAVRKYIALMADCHVGYGMPIGGVIACRSSVIPNAVGVDIGCGMIAVETDIDAEAFHEMKTRRVLLNNVKKMIPLGEGNSHKDKQEWEGFEKYIDSLDDAEKLQWPNKLDRRNLGTLGGGNHFIELQVSDKNKIWLMIHSGSRNLGQKVAKYYGKLAQELNAKWNSTIPDKNLAFLTADSIEGGDYIRDMNFALDYALENRQRMMKTFKEQLSAFMNGKVEFLKEINIHHNYASLENHFGQDFWIHRKGATSAKAGEIGIIPGSMGTASYIVKGKGNTESFMSCSHGAGRCLGRRQATEQLTVEECDKSMEGIVFDRWNKVRLKWRKTDKSKYDLSEAPLAYKNIDEVMNAQTDLVEPIVKLLPIGVLKG